MGTERVVRHFQEELDQLKRRLLEMGGLAEEHVRLAIKGLVERDQALTDRVLRGDAPLNALHIEIDSRSFTLLALHQPMAADLRTIVAAVKINTDLERVGDLAVNIAERAQSLIRLPPFKPLVDTPALAALVEDMLHRSLDAFVQRDAEMAAAVLPADDDVDKLRNRIYDELKEIMQQSPGVVSPAVDLMFVARNLERIADHATNIAEDVIYLVRGVDVRHHAYHGPHVHTPVR